MTEKTAAYADKDTVETELLEVTGAMETSTATAETQNYHVF